MWAFDLSADALARVVAGGATAATSAADAAAGADVIITMLPAGSHVRAAYEGDLFAVAQPHAILIDCSTIDVATAKAMGEAAASKGLAMVDAPVSGGVKRAVDGSLAIMVGGGAADLERARPLLGAMGKTITLCGPAGAAAVAMPTTPAQARANRPRRIMDIAPSLVECMRSAQSITPARPPQQADAGTPALCQTRVGTCHGR